MTERNFVFDLELLLELFVKPIRAREILPLRVAQDLFINIESLADFHRHLYKQLQADASPLGITRAFSPSMLAELEQLYTVYMGHYEKALELYYDRRDNAAQFRKFLKQCADFHEKSISNLLVTPMQRVCKYELMLKSIIRWHRKTAKAAGGTPDAQLVKHCRLLRIRIDELGAILQKVDRKRAAADRWETVCKLEQSLLVSEALAKIGRYFVAQADFSMRVFDSVHGSSTTDTPFTLLLFNDLLLRTKVARKAKKSRVLESLPLSQVYIIDSSADSTVPVLVGSGGGALGGGGSASGSSNSNSGTSSGGGGGGSGGGNSTFYIVNADPRGAFWAVSSSNQAATDEWLQQARAFVPSNSRFCEQWHLGADETLLAADACQWPHAYITNCRIYVTSHHLCLSWKMFGSSEREIISLNSVTNVRRRSAKSSKDPDANQLEIHTNTWRQSYVLTSLLNIEHTFRTIDGARQYLHAQSFLLSKQITANSSSNNNNNTAPEDLTQSVADSTVEFTPFLLDDNRWAELWASGSALEIEQGKAIIVCGKPNNSLFLVLDGSVTIEDASTTTTTVATVTQVVGSQSFLDGKPARLTVRGGATGVRLLVLDRQSLVQNLVPEQLAAFFATLAFKSSTF
jgi:hypothetical protein